MSRVVDQVLPAGSRLLLVIDQFEELFTLTQDEETRRLFLDGLVSLAEDDGSPVTVVVTMRADFLDRPLRYPEFGELLGAGMVTVAAPGPDELVEAVTRPAVGSGRPLRGGPGRPHRRRCRRRAGGAPAVAVRSHRTLRPAGDRPADPVRLPAGGWGLRRTGAAGRRAVRRARWSGTRGRPPSVPPSGRRRRVRARHPPPYPAPRPAGPLPRSRSARGGPESGTASIVCSPSTVTPSPAPRRWRSPTRP